MVFPSVGTVCATTTYHGIANQIQRRQSDASATPRRE